MNFDTDPADERFRCEVKHFLATTLLKLFPEKMRLELTARSFDAADARRWTRALNAKGWLVPHWPQQGESSWPHTWRRILAEELIEAHCPGTDAIGTDFVGPVLCAFGSDEQKSRYLPAIRNGEQFWCQGFSESEAGSDVMSLRTTAVRERDNYIVNGRKLWTSSAHSADMMFALLRIEIPGVRRQQGLSFLLIDMHAAGVHVSPVILIDGVHRVNEVRLENVKVPATNLVGEPGKGWVYARYLLSNERTVVAGLGHIRQLLKNLRAIAASRSHGESDLLADPLMISRLSQFEVELQALEFMELRLLHAHADDSARHVLPPMLKLRGSELRQRITEISLQILGEPGLELPNSLAPHGDSEPAPLPGPSLLFSAAVVDYLFQRSGTIAGGTSEIQRNLIAATALQL